MIFLIFSALLIAADRPEEIRRVIRGKLTDVRACYVTALEKDPKLKGKIVVDFDINDQGKVMRTALNADRSTLKNEKVFECIAQTLKSWEFPAAPKGETTTVTFPFLLDTNYSTDLLIE